MTVQTVLTAVAILIALAALMRARRVAKRLEQVIESYWELRYEYGQLRAHIDKLQGKPFDSAQGKPDTPSPDPLSGSTAFVPLSSIRRT